MMGQAQTRALQDKRPHWFFRCLCCRDNSDWVVIDGCVSMLTRDGKPFGFLMLGLPVTQFRPQSELREAVPQLLAQSHALAPRVSNGGPAILNYVLTDSV